MSLRYPGGLITKSPTAPTTSAAKGVWTLEQALQYIKAGTWPLSLLGDPYFQYNTILLPGQGTNGAQNNSFLDSGTANSGVGFPLNRSGNPTQGTFTPFSGSNGYWSNYFNGANSDAIQIANNAAFDFGTADVTIETWVYLTSTSSIQNLIDCGPTGGSGFTSWGIDVTASGFIRINTYVSGNAQSLEATSNQLAPNQWNHIAFTRSSGTNRLFVNGALCTATGTFTQAINSGGNTVTIGRGRYAGFERPATGFFSNVRITKAGALYTAAFTPSTTPLTTTVSAGTVSLLTCQSNRFVDNSANAFAITTAATPAVTPFQPFGAPTTAYSASTIGGSGYFDGSGDYLSSPIDAAFQFGTGDFTIESWWYPTTISSTYQSIAGVWLTSQYGWLLQVRSTDVLVAVGGGSFTVVGSATIAPNQWHHVAATRSGTTVRVFLNGVLLNSGTSSASATASTSLQIARNEDGNQQYVNGYLSGTRLVKGGALYTATFTPPTSPPTTTVSSGTVSLLLNYTNAGIIDNAQKNDLETVANAQISTAQYKWGTSSMYFDGTGDQLIAPSNEVLAFGTGDFTVELWARFSSLSTYNTLCATRPTTTGTADGWSFGATSSGTVYMYTDSFVAQSGTGVISTSTWYHLSLVRVGTTVKIFVNGNQVATGTNSQNLTRKILYVGNNTPNDEPFTGYLADLRITKGYARYPYSFTAPTAALPLFYQAAATPSADPYFDYTTLLLPGNGTNGAQNNTFLDSSTNAFTITRNGNTTQGTFTPFSQTGWGNYFDGSSVLFNTSTASSAFNLSTGSFTIEAWVYLPSVASYQYVLQLANTAGNTSGLVFGINSSGQPYIGNGVVLGNSGSYALVANTWNHLAVVSNGTTIQFYTNGVANGSSQSFNPNAAQYFYVGRDASGSNALTGYISNLRVTKGAALYTSNFIPSTTPLTTTVSSGTVSLLTCQSNRFVDNSTNAFAISTSGSPSVQAFSPFNPTAAYSTSTVGGSGYFDGSGDYLTYSPSTSNQFGTGSFTVEAWYYPLSTPTGVAAAYIYDARTASVLSTWILGCRLNGTGVGNLLGWFNGSATLEGSALTVNAWNHIVYVRNSGTNTGSLFLNGTRTATQTDTTNYSSTGATATIGSRYNNTDFLNGYLQDLRIVKGTAVYDASATSITIPTAPLTAITNTSLLTNFTNGAIIDNTAKNDLETVGNASISTAQSKFGGSSMYFDGSGDWLLYPATPSANFGTGDLTIEGWIYLNTTASNFYVYCSSIVNFSSPHFTFLYDSTNGLRVYAHAGSQVVQQGSTSGWSTGTWYHVAFVRYGGTVTLYRNGISIATATGWSSVSLGNATSTQVVGGSVVDNISSNGYMQDVRITRGIARYTTNFTPPTTAFLTL
jgi:hypothetical protein